jgi:pimeloyl-ACP methyl ester carboxylesterase
MQKIGINGFELNYESTGRGNVVLLLHAMGMDHEEWKYQVPTLSKHFNVIACDLRGHGESSKEEPGKFSIELLATDIERLLTQLGVSKMHLVGHSLGGMVACYFAVKHPEVLKSLVLMGVPFQRVPPSMSIMLALMPLMVQIYSPEKIGKMGVSQMCYNTTEEKIQMHMDKGRKAGKATWVGDAKVVKSFYMPQELFSLSIPVLLVYGETDIMKKDAGKLQNAILNSKLVFIPKAGHAMQIDNPEEVNKVLFEFLLSND